MKKDQCMTILWYNYANLKVQRDLYGYMEGQKTITMCSNNYTRVKNALPEESWRFDTCVVDSLKSNPFINNTQHKSMSIRIMI